MALLDLTYRGASRSGPIISVTSFNYLGSLVESHSGVQMKLNARISHAATAFRALKRSVYNDCMISVTMATKLWCWGFYFVLRKVGLAEGGMHAL